MKWMMFIKHLQTLPLPEAGRAIKDLGFKGVDLTVRPNGAVTPEKVKKALPEAIRVLHDWGLSVPLVTTEITSTSTPADFNQRYVCSRNSCSIRALRLSETS